VGIAEAGSLRFNLENSAIVERVNGSEAPPADLIANNDI
jgi:hypothetical protein